MNLDTDHPTPLGHHGPSRPPSARRIKVTARSFVLLARYLYREGLTSKALQSVLSSYRWTGTDVRDVVIKHVLDCFGIVRIHPLAGCSIIFYMTLCELLA